MALVGNDQATRPPEVLRSPRLDLALVGVAALRARARAPGPAPLALDSLVGYPVRDPDDVLHPDRSPLLRRIAQLDDDPDAHPWLLRVAVERTEGVAVGVTNFHAPPDPQGMVELGYSVVGRHRGRGYGTEMARAMWRFAANHPDVVVLRASVRPDNVASRSIIEAAGLIKVDEMLDPDDGLEWVYESPAATYRRRHPG
jgi:RimJ/RimL family protein N-acetyltransferase